MGVRLHIWGERACFTRPEMKVERVSYDVITPSAARGILDAIHWAPAIRWHIDRIHILKPIRFQSVRRNEASGKVSAANARMAMNERTTEGLGLLADENQQQRGALVLTHVAYVIEAHFSMTAKAGPGDSAGKHISIFRRRAEIGQCFHRPYLGTREFPAEFSLITKSGALPFSDLSPNERDADFGWILLDIDFAGGSQPRFFRAKMRDGIIDVPPFHETHSGA